MKLAVVTDVRPELAKVRVYVPAAAVRVKFVNSANPLVVVIEVVPLKDPPDAVTVIVVPVVVTKSPEELTSLIFASVAKVVGDAPPTG